MVSQCIRPAVVFLILMTVLTGVIYPLVVTAIAQVAFPDQANGSLIFDEGRLVGSSLIGQPFDDPKYFWSRPSATAPFPYNAAASSGSNQGPTEPNLAAALKDRVDKLRQADPGHDGPIPVDLITASASGLDPDVSPAAAEYQVPRVARIRGLPEDKVRRLVEEYSQSRTFGLLGEPRVNVLLLNLGLDKLQP